MSRQARHDKLVVIVGPTGSGKSALAIELAKKHDGEIIAADSRTVYRYMDIGTAKPTREDMLLIPHHLIDIKNPNEHFSVADFQKQARRSIEEISSRGRLPIMVGGTGLYVDSVLFGYDFEKRTMHPTVRANTLVIGLLPPDKKVMHEHINDRIEKMLENGLLKEVENIGSKFGWESEAMSGLAYRVFRGVVKGSKSLEDAKAEYVQAEKDFIKRQMTWFKRNKEINWLKNPDEAESLVRAFLAD